MTMPDKYCPSNGTEGDSFISAWCGTCARDRALRDGCPIEECDDDEVCDIVSRTFLYQVEDPEYPVEWIYGEAGPCCTAYIPAGEPISMARCAHTVDMFNVQHEAGE